MKQDRSQIAALAAAHAAGAIMMAWSFDAHGGSSALTARSMAIAVLLAATFWTAWTSDGPKKGAAATGAAAAVAWVSWAILTPSDIEAAWTFAVGAGTLLATLSGAIFAQAMRTSSKATFLALVVTAGALAGLSPAPTSAVSEATALEIETVSKAMSRSASEANLKRVAGKAPTEEESFAAFKAFVEQLHAGPFGDRGKIEMANHDFDVAQKRRQAVMACKGQDKEDACVEAARMIGSETIQPPRTRIKTLMTVLGSA